MALRCAQCAKRVKINIAHTHKRRACATQQIPYIAPPYYRYIGLVKRSVWWQQIGGWVGPCLMLLTADEGVQCLCTLVLPPRRRVTAVAMRHRIGTFLVWRTYVRSPTCGLGGLRMGCVLPPGRVVVPSALGRALLLCVRARPPLVRSSPQASSACVLQASTWPTATVNIKGRTW